MRVCLERRYPEFYWLQSRKGVSVSPNEVNPWQYNRGGRSNLEVVLISGYTIRYVRFKTQCHPLGIIFILAQQHLGICAPNGLQTMTPPNLVLMFSTPSAERSDMMPTSWESEMPNDPATKALNVGTRHRHPDIPYHSQHS